MYRHRFYDEVRAGLAEVCAHPLCFRQIDPPVRRYFVPSFRYALLYIAEPDQVWVIAVAPLRREPGYWKHRLTK